MSSSRVELRRAQFKKGADSMEDARRKREEQTNGLRKSKKEESLQKRRNLMSSRDTESESASSTASSSSSQHNVQQDLARLNDLVAGLRSDDPIHALDCTVRIRKLLSVKTNPPIDAVINAGAVPLLIHLLTAVAHPQIQFEACWALTNIASGSLDQTMVVVQQNGIPMFVKLLEMQSPDVREQAVWALANISGENTQLRDEVLKHGALRGVLAQFNANPAPSLSMVRNCTWAISNFCRGNPPPSTETAEALLPALAHLIKHQDENVASDACWAVSYLSQDGEQEAIRRLIAIPGLVQQMVLNLTNHAAPSVITPSLRTIGNIVTGDEAQTQMVIDAGVCGALHGLLSSKKRSVRKEACWAYSNITAGTQSQIQSFIECGCIPELLNLFAKDEAEVRKECCWIFSNITCGGTSRQIREVVRSGLIAPMCDYLSRMAKTDVRMTTLILQTFKNILKTGEKLAARDGQNVFSQEVEEHGGLDLFEELQQHQNDEVYKIAASIIDEFYPSEDDAAVDYENQSPVSENIPQQAFLKQSQDQLTFSFPAAPSSAPFNFSF